jgi:hypothetical protein
VVESRVLVYTFEDRPFFIPILRGRGGDKPVCKGSIGPTEKSSALLSEICEGVHAIGANKITDLRFKYLIALSFSKNSMNIVICY